MSIDVISLRKLMQLMLASDGRRTSLLRSNITAELRRERNGPSDGGDFHSPFWADAKAHVGGAVNLREATPARIRADGKRARLYPLLTEGFLQWWEERRRRRNEPIQVTQAQIKGRVALEGLGVVKIENNLGFSIGDNGYRVIYPYFCEEPELRNDVARVGLWAISQALPTYDLDDLRIIDVLRSTSFSTSECPFRGTEGDEFRAEYARLLARWQELREEY